MNTSALLMVAVLSAATANACTGADMMNGAQSSMHEALANAETENNRHAAACGQADSMPAMLAELEMHETNMTPIMARMDHALGGMAHCSGDSDALSSSMTHFRAELSDHASRLRGSGTVAAAHTMCSDHNSMMGTMMENMMTNAAGMSCMAMHR